MSTPHHPPVLVTGATGRIGRLVVAELLRIGASVRALTRRPAHAALPAGVDVVTGDFTKPASLDAALDGAEAVFLLWTADASAAPGIIDKLASRTDRQHRRVVYLSAPHRTPHPFFQQPNPMRLLHAEVERLLEASGLDVAVIRPGMFASNALHWWAPQLSSGDVVRWPYAAAETAPIDERDVAAVAARVLVDAPYARGDFVLTGPESLSQAAQVRAIGDAVGRQVRLEEISPEQFRQEAEGVWPPGVAEMLLSAWRATLGHRAFVTDAVQRILDAPPRPFHQWAVDNAGAFASARGRTKTS